MNTQPGADGPPERPAANLDMHVAAVPSDGRALTDDEIDALFRNAVAAMTKHIAASADTSIADTSIADTGEESQ